MRVLFQYVLKGIADLSEADGVQTMGAGILCGWWRRVHVLPFDEVADRLTQPELTAHLSAHKSLVPGESYTVGENSPFISTTAGTYQTVTSKTYDYYSAEWTAIRFATNTFRSEGVIFRAWVPVLGKPSLPLTNFAEEVRDPNQYSDPFGYHHQGEVTAKIIIPSTQIEGFWVVSGPAFKAAAKAKTPPSLGPLTQTNSAFVNPHDFSNVRDLV